MNERFKTDKKQLDEYFKNSKDGKLIKELWLMLNPSFHNDYSILRNDELLDPIIKVQISDLQEDNKRSIRFVAAIPDLNVSAKFIRVMYDEEGNEFKG